MNIYDLDEFTKSYIDAALALSHDERAGADIMLIDNHDASELTSEALAQIVEECKAFQAIPVVQDAIKADAYTGQNPEGVSCADMCGHFFWLTRNGHGAGFWDDRWGSFGDTLDLHARLAGERSLYLGDDGRIHYGPN